MNWQGAPSLTIRRLAQACRHGVGVARPNNTAIETMSVCQGVLRSTQFCSSRNRIRRWGHSRHNLRAVFLSDLGRVRTRTFGTNSDEGDGSGSESWLVPFIIDAAVTGTMPLYCQNGTESDVQQREDKHANCATDEAIFTGRGGVTSKHKDGEELVRAEDAVLGTGQLDKRGNKQLPIRIYWDADNVAYTKDTFDRLSSRLPNMQVCYHAS